MSVSPTGYPQVGLPWTGIWLLQLNRQPVTEAELLAPHRRRQDLPQTQTDAVPFTDPLWDAGTGVTETRPRRRDGFGL